MKKSYIYYLLILLLSVNSVGFSQFVDYENDKGWNLGFNMGGAWQPREVTSNSTTIPYAGFSGGLTFGKSIYEKEGAFFAFDWRFRYLQGWNSGWETTPSTLPVDSGYVGFRNYKMNFNEYTLEGVLTLNRLRERTGIILYGFGGVGLTNYAVKSNYFDGSLNMHYDYSNIDLNATPIKIAEDLRRFDNDHNWETTTKARTTDFMPSLGWGLGYQFGPHFSMGVEWKTTYALHDNLDGIVNGINDRYNYASWFFRWNLFSSGGRTTYTVPNNNNNVVVNNNNNNNNNSNNSINNWTNPTTTNPVGNKPLVNITNPSASNMSVTNSAFTIMANVYYVAGNQDIIFKHNGVQLTNFTYNSSTNKFVAGVVLQPGNNVFEIIGKNQYGTDADSKIIVLQQQVITLPPPIVTITNPPYTPYTVSNQNFTVTATILNISQANQISFKVNGINNGNFSFNPNTNVFSSPLMLQQGNNTIQITATNAQGSSSQVATINYQVVTIQPPVVTINYPNQNPFTTNSSLESITATVLNVNSQSQTSVTVNGSPITNYTFNASTHKLTLNAVLINGANIVQVTGTNTAGSDSKTQTIIYTKPQTMPKPVVTFVVPSSTPYNVSVSNMTIRAKVLNVSGSDDINVTANGNNLSNFVFNSLTKEVVFNTNLITGNNVFVVKGTNQAGSDQKQTIVVYEKPVKENPPMITITNPGVNPFSTTVSQEIINADIANVSNVSGVTASFNGSSITNFTYDPITGKFVYNASLNSGANVLTINAVNTAGTASKSQTIIYSQPACLKPVITLVAPAQNPFNTTSSNGYIEANIQNGGTVNFKINGQTSPEFNYQANTGKFTYTNAQLSEGASVYTISATNECGTTTESVTIVYTGQQPCDEPSVSFINPATNPFTYNGKNGNYSISASVVHASGQNNVTVKHNGTPVVFNYDANNYIVSANVTLAQGSNSFEVSATNECGTTTQTTVVSFSGIIAQLPSPQIILSSPSNFPYSTTNSSVTVSGKVLNVDSKNNISVLFDGQPISSFTYNTTSKTISIPLTLTAGGHTLGITATNSVGNDQKSVELILTGNTPVVMISNYSTQTSTSNPTIIAQPNVTVTGNVQNYQGATFSVKVNNANYTNFNYNSSNGQFSIPLTLNTNQVYTIEASASNQFGNDSKATHLKYTPPPPPCVSPVITLTNPAGGTGTATSGTGRIEASITGAPNVIFKINGQNSNAFSFNSTTGAFVASNIPLVKGSLGCEIIATNDCGTDSKAVTLIYEVELPPCNTPTLNFTNPATNPFNYQNANSSYAFNVSTQNVADGNTIVAKLNNNTINASYNSKGGGIIGNVNLTPGTNLITVTVTNDCGTETVTTTINYSTPEVTPPCNSPAVNINSPSTSPNNYSNTSNSYTLTANVTNVSSQNNISVKQNGNPVNFNYNPSSHVVTANVTLSQGGNNFEVSATNDCGADTKSAVVNYSVPMPPPVITITSPASFPYTTTNNAVTVSGKVMNVNSKSDITVTLNGQSVMAFTYINASNVISIPVTLTAGSNTLAITATNSVGNDQKSVQLNLTGNPPVVVISNYSSPSSSSSPIIVSQSNITVTGNVQNYQGATFSVKVNNANYSNYNYSSSNGQFNISLALVENQVYVIQPSATNQFGNNSKQTYLKYIPTSPLGGNEENTDTSGYGNNKPNNGGGDNNQSNNTNTSCGPRFNPGNSSWEFCLVTPSGTFTRDNLHSNPGFTYSGSASSIYFKPIAGGGNAIVNGQQYTVVPGAYYLFTGSLTVDVSSSHPGSMGHWEVCINSNTAPISGNGNNRPTSPCETVNSNSNNGNSGNNGNNSNNSNNNGNSNSNNNSGNNGNNGNNGNHGSSSVQDQQYNEAIKKADMYYNAKKWETAKSFYEEALRIKPNESYPKARLAIIENKLKAVNTPHPTFNNNGGKVIKPINTNKPGSTNTNNNTNKTTTGTPKENTTTKPRTGGSTNTGTKPVEEKKEEPAKTPTPTVKPKEGGR